MDTTVAVSFATETPFFLYARHKDVYITVYHICEIQGNIVKAPQCGGKKRLRSNTCEHGRHVNANSELSFTVVQSAVEKAGGDFMARHVHHF